MALGAAISAYTTSLFAPELIAEFGWAKSDFALTGSISLVTLFFVPVAGRFTDRFGPRVAASVGFIAVPLSFFAYSMMSGDIRQYFAILFFQHLFGILTTTIVFARVVVERFDSARGMALSILMTGAPLMGALATPILGAIIDEQGWRIGFRVLAALSAVGGFTAIALMGRTQSTALAIPAEKRRAPSMSMKEFAQLARNPVFLLLLAGIALCNVPQIIVMSQLKLVLLENNAPGQLATWIVSLYAAGVIVGRFLCGLALDRVPAHIVAIFSLGLPALGYVALASSFDMAWLLAASVLIIGLAQGAEGDVGAYLTSRKFSMRHYSFIYSFLIASMGAASALGALVLSYTLRITDSFNTFLIISAVATIAGALAFYLTGSFDRVESDAEPLGEPA
ncbi:MAG: MFS transporter [Novosphingobium sp.]